MAVSQKQVRLIYTAVNDTKKANKEILSGFELMEQRASQTTAKMNASFTNLSKSTAKPIKGIDGLKSSLGTLAAQSAGVPGPLGAVTNALLQMGPSSRTIIGVVAGVGLVATVYDKLTEKAREAKRRTDDLIASILKIPGAQETADLLKRQRDSLEGIQRAQSVIASTSAMLDEPGMRTARESAIKDLKEKTKEYNESTRALNENTIANLTAAASVGVLTDSERKQAELQVSYLKNRLAATKDLQERTKYAKELGTLQDALNKKDKDSATKTTKTGRPDIDPFDFDPRLANPNAIDQKAAAAKSVGDIKRNTDFVQPIIPPVDHSTNFDKVFNSFSSRFDELTEGLTNVGSVGEEVGKSLADAFAGFGLTLGDAFDAVGQGANVFGSLAKAAKKAVGDAAGAEGQKYILSGFAKIKDAIWPPNPAALASGLGLVAAGGALKAFGSKLGGGASGGAGASGGTGGAGSGNGTSATNNPETRQRQTTFIFDGFPSPHDPHFQDWFAASIGEVTNQRILVRSK